MLMGAIIAIFLILALFLAMLGQSPKSDSEYQTDTEA